MISIAELNARHAEKEKTDLGVSHPHTNHGKKYCGIYFKAHVGFYESIAAGLPIRTGYVDWYDDEDEAKNEFEKLTPLSFGEYRLETDLSL